MIDVEEDEIMALNLIGAFARQYCWEPYYNGALFFSAFGNPCECIYYKVDYDNMKRANAYFHIYLPFYYRIGGDSIPVKQGEY